jgi:hypothetical protein
VLTGRFQPRRDEWVAPSSVFGFNGRAERPPGMAAARTDVQAALGAEAGHRRGGVEGHRRVLPAVRVTAKRRGPFGASTQAEECIAVCCVSTLSPVEIALWQSGNRR